MDRIVKIKAYSNGNLFAEETLEEGVDLQQCRIEKETLENGIVVETYYLAAVAQ